MQNTAVYAPIKFEEIVIFMITWSMAAILRDSIVVVVVRTRPRAIPLAMITMRKFIDGFA